MTPDPAVVLAELRAFRARSARELRAYARELLKAADLLDPPPPPRRPPRKSAAPDSRLDGPTGLRAAGLKLAREAAERHGFDPSKIEAKPGGGLVLDLGTAGHTSHPDDPDAQALAERLVHTEG